MRRFLIWSGLAALIGLVLAVVGVWAYGHFYARFQPVTIDRNQAEVERLLAQSSWISETEGGEPALYVVGDPRDPALRNWLREEGDKLRASGAQVRVVPFLPADAENRVTGSATDRAAIAELWLGRDPGLLNQWLAASPEGWTAPGLTPAEGNLARTAVADASARFSDDLANLMSRAGVRAAWPMVIWRDREGFLRACACSDRRSWAFVRDELDAPDAISRGAEVLPLEPGGEETFVPATPPVAAPPAAAPLPYPNVDGPKPTTPTPSAPSQPPVVTPPPASTAPPARPVARPSPPSRLERPTPRPAPAKREPSRPRPPEEEDTRFY